jgi:hypothetical protein
MDDFERLREAGILSVPKQNRLNFRVPKSRRLFRD